MKDCDSWQYKQWPQDQAVLLCSSEALSCASNNNANQTLMPTRIISLLHGRDDRRYYAIMFAQTPRSGSQRRKISLANAGLVKLAWPPVMHMHSDMFRTTLVLKAAFECANLGVSVTGCPVRTFGFLQVIGQGALCCFDVALSRSYGQRCKCICMAAEAAFE
jgi:hypothetical protein